jgi:hypothetical protein
VTRSKYRAATGGFDIGGIVSTHGQIPGLSDERSSLHDFAHAHTDARMAEAFSASPWHDGFDAWLAAVVNHWTDGNDTRNWHSGDRLAATEAEGATDFGHLHLAGGSAGLKGLCVLPAGFAHRCARSPAAPGGRA